MGDFQHLTTPGDGNTGDNNSRKTNNYSRPSAADEIQRHRGPGARTATHKAQHVTFALLESVLISTELSRRLCKFRPGLFNHFFGEGLL